MWWEFYESSRVFIPICTVEPPLGQLVVLRSGTDISPGLADRLMLAPTAKSLVWNSR